MLYDNNIEKIDVSGYTDLNRLNIANNKLTFFSDLKLPTSIRHLNASGNQLRTLDGIDKLTQLKTLDLRNNDLNDDDLDKISELENLKVVLVSGNPDISPDLINRLNNFSQKYIATIKNPDTLDVNKHSYLK